VGVRFRSAVTGTVTGIRLYIGAGRSGQHRAVLWNSGGRILAKSHIRRLATWWCMVT
jgi:Domain of unknown function (DUF4082)